MNGIAFANVPRLYVIDLRGNVCVDERFSTQPYTSSFRRAISRNCAANNAAVKGISGHIKTSCEDPLKSSEYEWFEASSGCCVLDYGTFIDAPDYSFEASEQYTNIMILIIQFQGNIEFLPVLVHNTFPMLKVYSIEHTPIKKMFKKNFEKLFKLEFLRLIDNNIEVIKSNTFEDLISLRRISISNGDYFLFASILILFYFNSFSTLGFTKLEGFRQP